MIKGQILNIEKDVSYLIVFNENIRLLNINRVHDDIVEYYDDFDMDFTLYKKDISEFNKMLNTFYVLNQYYEYTVLWEVENKDYDGVSSCHLLKKLFDSKKKWEYKVKGNQK